MSDVLSNTLMTTILATGHVRNYQIVVSSVQLLNLPISYLCLRSGTGPEIVILVAIIISNIALFLRIYMLNKLIPISFIDFLTKVYFNVIIVGVTASIVPFLLNTTMEENMYRFITVTLVSLLYSMTIIYFVGCNKNERDLIYNKIKGFIYKKAKQ